VGLETLGEDYYERLALDYRARRDLLCRGPGRRGVPLYAPPGRLLRAGGLLRGIGAPGRRVLLLADEGGRRGARAGLELFQPPELGRRLVRFAFCKTEEMLAEAARRLAHVRRPARPVRA